MLRREQGDICCGGPLTSTSVWVQGPFGFEDTILAGGAALTLLGLFIFPVFWSAPIALMTAELSCMIPESGGHVLWVYRAFGPFWSFINSFFAFTCSVLDNALYPALFVEYLGALLYDNSRTVSYGWAVAIKIFVVSVAAMVNIVGVDVVGVCATANMKTSVLNWITSKQGEILNTSRLNAYQETRPLHWEWAFWHPLQSCVYLASFNSTSRGPLPKTFLPPSIGGSSLQSYYGTHRGLSKGLPCCHVLLGLLHGY